jgi:outer membrane protein assembly factor BamB
LFLLAGLTVLPLARAAQPEPKAPAPRRAPYKSLYGDRGPDFLDYIRGRRRGFRGWDIPEKKMRLSSEPTFFTLNIIEEDARANALVEAGLEKELAGQYRDALKIYQIVIDKYSHCLYRVSKFGIFVPVAEYCQRRILGFPPDHLAFYRVTYDAQAAEAFNQARRKHSLIGLSDLANRMLATSYGGRAILELGNASLDTGHYLAALERFTTIRDFFPYPELRTPELELKIAYCHKMLGSDPESARGPALESELRQTALGRLRGVVKSARRQVPPFHSQLASALHVTADDYTLMPPTTDPMGLKPPTWERTLSGSRQDYFVFTQPVVTENSVIYRHKNVVYCHSILNGELRWVNDLGGRAVWQNWRQHQFPQEDLLVQDGLVFTVVAKGGPSLIALDEVTGQVKWAYGPMVATTVEESRMRFLAAPAGGPRTVYTGYVLDNIEGETHTDTEYGLIAFESATGRIRWRTPLCRLAPGKFAAGFAEQRRNRIRSFVSPPLVHQGTVYYNTNAGAVAALDALSGRIKWLNRYPYYPSIHDATRTFRGAYPLIPGRRGTRLWFNQRPLVVGERLYVLPVDGPFLYCIDRRSGRVFWSKPQAGSDVRYFLGPISTGELAVVYSGRSKRIAWYGGSSCRPVHLLNPETGETVWSSPDLIAHEEHPVLRHYIFSTCAFVDYNHRWAEVAARPFLTSDDKLYVTMVGQTSPYYRYGARYYLLTSVDLKERKLTGHRRYYTGKMLAMAANTIQNQAPHELKAYQDLPHKNKDMQHRIQVMKDISEDTVPENEHGPFMPFSRVTFRRYGVPFELRFGPRELAMVYDRAAVTRALARRRDTAADFARAELGIAESRFADAAVLLQRCLQSISSEDLDFRALIHQQLYKVHKRLCRSAIRAGRHDAERAHCLGMARTASTLADEIETLFALSEAYERRGEYAAAGRCLRSIISTYGHHEYPVAPAAVSEPERLAEAARDLLDRAGRFADNRLYGKEFTRSLALLRRGLPLYLSTVSPLPKTLMVRAGQLAAQRLLRLRRSAPEFARQFEAVAASELKGRSPEEQRYCLPQFPGTKAAQGVLNGLFARVANAEGTAGQRERWRLADVARIAGLAVPEAIRPRVSAPPPGGPAPPVRVPQKPHVRNLAEAEGINWLVLERRGQRTRHPELLFLGGRVRKRLDNKFILSCFDLNTGKLRWQKTRIRLRGKGQEPGFFHAFVYRDLVVVHGLYDVLACDVADGSLRWRHRVPFDFEIKQSVMTGDLLILSGAAETLALHVPSRSAAGDVAWQVREHGDLYSPPYLQGDRLVSVRKMPFNITVRFRATGKLIGRLDLPDLSMHDKHPLLEKGPAAVPIAHDAHRLAVTDGWYYILVDVERMKVLWKRLIDNNDLTREPAMRLVLGGDYLAVLKEDYDQKALYMLSNRTGRVLWHTDPKDANSPQPMYSMHVHGDTLYGLGVHPGQGFYIVARDCKTGKLLFNRLTKGYAGKPQARVLPGLYGDQAAVLVQDRKEFELRMYDAGTGEPLHKVHTKGVGPFAVHGRVSATVQHGRTVLLSKDELQL